MTIIVTIFIVVVIIVVVVAVVLFLFSLPSYCSCFRCRRIVLVNVSLFLCCFVSLLLPSND